MSENKNAVDLFLTEAKTLEERRQDLIRTVMDQREAAIREYDSQLAKLGQKVETRKRSHHKRSTEGATVKSSSPARPMQKQG